MKIIGGPASQLLASRVAAVMDCELALCEFKTFPDKEMYIRILEETGPDAIIIQSTVTDSDFIALLQLIDACSSAESIHVVIPYMGYARQDKKFKSGEALSARAMARAIEADNVITVNIHEESILDHFRCDSVNINAAPDLGKYLQGMDLNKPILLAPDDGALGLASSAAEELGYDYDYLEKKRLSGDTVEMSPKNLDVSGRDVVILDDIIATGGTMAEAARMLKSQGAADIYIACIHPVLSGSAVIKLCHFGVKNIIATDTIEKAVSKVSVAPLLAGTLKRL